VPLIVREGLVAIIHRALVGALPDELAGHITKLPPERSSEFEHLDLPHLFREINRVHRAVIPERWTPVAGQG